MTPGAPRLPRRRRTRATAVARASVIVTTLSLAVATVLGVHMGNSIEQRRDTAVEHLDKTTADLAATQSSNRELRQRIEQQTATSAELADKLASTDGFIPAP